MLTNLSFLEEGKPFPPDSERKRLDRYKENKLLFEDEHAVVYKEQFKRIERVIGNFGKVISYAAVFNFQKLMTLKIADFVFGDPPDITAGTDELQACIDRIITDTDFFGKMYMAAIDVSRYGDGVLQAFRTESRADFDIYSPAYWFPVVDNNNIRKFLYHCFCTVYLIDSKKKQYGLCVQIHCPEKPGRCEERSYILDGQPGSFRIGKMLTSPKEPDMETKFDVCPVFRVSNTAVSDRCFGIDDYSSVDSIVSELMIRVSQAAKVLDKFSCPSVSGPQSALEWSDEQQGYIFGLKDNDELGNVDERITVLETKNAAVLAQAKESIIDAELRALHGYDSKLLGRLIDRSKLTFGEDGRIQGLAEAVKAVETEFPAVRLPQEKEHKPFVPINPGSNAGEAERRTMNDLIRGKR